MDMAILQIIQGWRTPALDSFMVTVFHTVIDEKGVFAVLLGLVLFAFKKTRKYGGVMLLSILLSYLFGGLLLKNLIARPRPFLADSSVVLPVQTPKGYSCPSLHTAFAFGCAVSVFLQNKKVGIPALLFAALIGFSRLYFFVHYPSDVLLGAALGSICAFAAYKLVQAFIGWRNARRKIDA